MLSRILTFLFLSILITSQAYAQCVTTLYYKKVVDVEGGIINTCHYPRPVLENSYVVDKISDDICSLFDPHCSDVENFRTNFLNTGFSITCDDDRYYGVYLYVNSTQYPGSVWGTKKYPEYLAEYFRLYDKKNGNRLFYSDFANIPSIDVLRQRIVNGEYKVFDIWGQRNTDWHDNNPFGGMMNEKRDNLAGIASLIESFSGNVVMDAKHNVYLLYSYGNMTKSGGTYYAVRIKSTVPEKPLSSKIPLYDSNLSFKIIKNSLNNDGVIIEGELYNKNRFPVLVKTVHLDLALNQSWGQSLGPADFTFDNPTEIAPCSFKRVTLMYKPSSQQYNTLRKYRNFTLVSNPSYCRIFRYY